MVEFVTERGQQVSVPDWVQNDLDAFRRWLDSDDIPKARIWFLKGKVSVDMSKEEVYTHVRVKTEIARVIETLAKSRSSGMFLTDGVRLTNTAASISGNPD